MKLSSILKTTYLGFSLLLTQQLVAQDHQVALYQGNDLLNINPKKHLTKHIGQGVQYHKDDISHSNKIALFPSQISKELEVAKDWVFFQGVNSPHNPNQWIYMERAEIGKEFSLWLYDSRTTTKRELLNLHTMPIKNYSFKPFAWGKEENIVYVELIKFDTDFDHEGIWELNIQTKQLRPLQVDKDYFTTPILSPDRNYFLYLKSNEEKRNLLHGFADEVMTFSLTEQKEKTLLRKPNTPLALVGWLDNNTNPQIKAIEPPKEEQIDHSNQMESVEYYLPWDTNRGYYVSRHGTPAPSGFHNPTGARVNWYDGIGQHAYAAIDFDTPDDADHNMRASAAGVVTSAGDCGCGYGNLVIVRHSDGTRTYYAHLKRILVSLNQSVNHGTIVGHEGTTGQSSGDHLHFEWRAAGGNSSTIGTFTDVGQPRQGYFYVATNGGNTDTTAPTTSINSPSHSINDFTATFTDADNVGISERFYQVLENQTGETRANRGNGFFNDNFSTSSLHTDYTTGDGSWGISSGRLRQTNTSTTNTSLSTFLSQTNGQSYLYNFAAKLNNTTGNRRFGLHIMASSNTASERGNSYLIWFATDASTVSILETVNNVLNTRASANLTTGTSWSDYKITYNTSTGKIEVFRNNAKLLEWTDTSPLTSGSYASFRTNQADVEFDDFKVYKGRSTGVTITVGNTNSKDLRTTLASTGQLKSIVRDAAGNWSDVANANVSLFPSDIANNWAETEILYMLQNGYISGYSDGTFRPNNQLTRAEFATMIVNSINPEAKPNIPTPTFSDVTATHWAKSNIEKAVRGGYLSGYPDGTFKPNDPITKLQVNVSLSNGLNLSGGTSSLLNLFTDKADIPSWATTSISHAIANRFVANYPDKNYYKPNENSTRANATVVIYQSLRYLSRINGTPVVNNYIVVPTNPVSKLAEFEEGTAMLSQINLYPNPIQEGKLSIDYILTVDSPISLKVYNTLGEEISILYQGDKKAGAQHQEVDISTLGLKTGTYLIKVFSKNSIETLRFIKL